MRHDRQGEPLAPKAKTAAVSRGASELRKRFHHLFRARSTASSDGVNLREASLPSKRGLFRQKRESDMEKQPVQTGQKVELTITGYSHSGEGVGKYGVLPCLFPLPSSGNGFWRKWRR